MEQDQLVKDQEPEAGEVKDEGEVLEGDLAWAPVENVSVQTVDTGKHIN